MLRPADYVVVALAALFVGASYAAFWRSGEAGGEAVISVGDAWHSTVSLDADQAVVVTGRIGESHIQVSDGRVRFTHAPCPGRYCIHAGWLSLAGQVAACLPNTVVVEVRGGTEGYDAITL